MRVSRIVREQARVVTRPVHTVVGGVSPADFVREYQLNARPALFKQLIVAQLHDQRRPHTLYWPALHAWSHVQDGRETLAGLTADDSTHVIVPVEVCAPGHGYTTAAAGGDEWQRIEMPFGVFVDAFVRQKIAWSEQQQRKVGYLAQFDLLSAVPRLAKDAPSLEHTRAGPKQDREQWRSNTWIGPADTFTPLHRDPYHNLFVQVVGRKRVHLLAPSLAQTLLEGGSGNTVASVLRESDLLTPDPTRNPALHKALANNNTLTSAVLHPGDVLYIPHGWLHCVQSLSTSVSVNFWYR